ncbi:23S rRNA (adenine(2030)-N(6))-methyltransferase RlmJ [Aestuariibacter halophilus]|uniref:Ribosomal RNA large subunit methyltransferase J n=1 Tax=Fluctibacter halophilus TaxID=226011 RepID=A0ABS8G548_9ALTE|nr:23S rRNA (adenine(2030)-N(6))-methyltransferase RlmJ [Aestuariibacter halophilus]MCC2615655.1 23S rRNA (adenine(2030)-N(6))-methyltransferase RlmJ [Aestuariibacter halophilus]
MLSYRHGFHAANHADVLKHFCEFLILDKLKEKNKPFVYIDTHSGAGVYRLDDEFALKNREFDQGMALLLNQAGSLPERVRAFIALISNDWIERRYPGSAGLAQKLVREQDHLHLMELHSQEVLNLKQNVRGEQVHIHHRDGLEGLVALTPPKPARGLVLIDPPFERLDEYSELQTALQRAVKQWQTGIYMIWYPRLSARAGQKVAASQRLLDSIAALPCKNVLHATLDVADPADDPGMYGSGIVVINAPYQLDVQLEQTLPAIASALAGSGGKTQINWLKRGTD